MAEVLPPPDGFPVTVETLIIGAGAAGLTAALAATGRDVLILERDPVPSGSTALSAGLIPAPGTRFQRSLGIDDTPALFAADIQRKAKNENDPALVNLFAQNAGPAVEWLADDHDLPFSLVDDFDYPGHSRRRMHGLPTRSGRELVDRLRKAVEASGAGILCDAPVHRLYADGNRIHGVASRRPDRSVEEIGCQRLILACNGFGGNGDLVARHMPEIADAVWFGHDGNKGEAVLWGDALGAETAQLGAYQGHGNVAHPHGILITWAVVSGGGVQVNTRGERFWDESQGYSEAARAVLAQPDGIAFTVFDETRAKPARQFADYTEAEAQGAIKSAETLSQLAETLGLPGDALEETIAEIPKQGTDRFGRSFDGPPLAPPYFGVKVTGALFHTQGGLVTDAHARVRRTGSGTFTNLYAAGGAACGVSGSSDAGYLSGNGLLSAVVLGRLAGLG